MTINDIQVAESAHGAQPTWNWLRDDRDTSSEVPALAGEILKTASAASQFAVRAVDADFTVGTDQPVIGVVQTGSTETATVDGSVEAFQPLPGMVYTALVQTTTLADTDSEIDAIKGEYLVLNLSATSAAGIYTLDTAAGSGASNALLIVGGNSSLSQLRFMIAHHATAMGRGSA